MEMKLELQPFRTPNYVLAKAKIGLRQDGFTEGPKWALKEVPADILAVMCDQFRKEIFLKAKQDDPHRE